MGSFDGDGADNFWTLKFEARSATVRRPRKTSTLPMMNHHWLDHLMFYTPFMDGAVWGADLPKSPVMRNPQFSGAPEPIDVFMVPTRRWSDGTAASVM